MNLEKFTQNNRRIPLLKPIFVLTLFVVSFFAKGQTTLINPTGEGGFENGGTFAANNWTVVNTGTANGSQWFVTTSDLTNGSYSFVRTGSNAAYISNNSGANWRYNTTPASTSSHLYKDVTFPSGETAISLTFRYNVNGESSWDEMYVYLCPQTLTPVANSPSSSSTSVTWTGSGTATLLGTFRLLSAGTGATGNISISGATAGNISANSNMRLVFTWKNDGSGGAEPPAAIDDISLTSAVPVPVSGIKTIGSSGDFTTLGAAVNYLVANGINGATTLQLQTTYTSASESYPITLGAVSGASIANTITIVPNVGATALNISGSSATALIDINGGDYWRIDGRPGGSGSAKELTLSNTNTSGVAIRYIADATNNIVRNCIVQGVNTSSSGAVISFSSGTTTGNDDNTIQNCDIRDGASTPNNGIYSLGTSTAISNDNITIQDNNIFNFFQSANSTSGININSNNNNWTVSGNSFYQTADRTYTTSNQHNGIFISNSNASATFTISGNFIGGKAASCGGGAYTMLGAFTNRFVGISVSAASTATTSIQGNTIANFSTNTTSSATTSNGNFCAIWVSGGNANIGTVTGNTIGATTGTGNITVNLQTNSGGTSNLIVYSGSSTVNISNNTIGSITLTGASTTIGIGFNGIWVSGGTPTITNNTIGSTSTANSINSSTIVTGTQVQALMGIQVTSGVTNTTVITGNTIANINQAGTSTSTSSTLRGISFAGASAAYTYNISNNTIRNLSGANANTNTNMLTSVVGIVATSGASTAGSQITNNVIYSLANTNTGSVQTTVLGIGYSTATSTNISRNKIYDLRNASTMTTATTPPVVAGIGLRSTGTNATISNNMISLGSSQITNTEFIGIWNNFNAPGFIIHHNSVIITGTASSGALPTFAFVRGDNSATGLTTPLTFRNNIFINERSGGTGKHYAIGNQGTPLVTTGWTSASSNYNILNSSNSSILGLWGPTDYDFASWKTNTSGDNNSFNAVTVTFTDQANGDLHLNMGVSATVLESSGDNTTNTGITSDYDGNTRPGPSGSVNGGGISPDFGADEFDGTPLDLSPPSIGVTALSNTCSTGDRNIIGVTIADVTGVPVAGALQPRIYYRKNAGTWFSSQGSLTSGTATNGTWSFTIVATDMGGLNTTDAVQYYFIAQDVSGTPNIGSNPSSGLVASDVNTVTTSPTSPSSYTIAPVLSGTYNVGTGQTYTTLTAAVSAYNNGCLTGAVTFQLMDATYSGETLPITINNHTDASATNTLTIKPASGVTASLSGSSSSAIITLNGADYVTIDGSNDGSTSRNFTITNTNTGTSSAVVWMQTASSGSGTSATNNIVKNCVITGNSNTTTLFGIGSGSSTISTSSLGTSNNNNTIQNNNISKVQHGIYSQGASAATKNTGTTISNNLLNTASPNNIATTGIRVGFEDGVSITGNEIDALQAPGSTDAVAIGLGSASVSTSTFTGNEVINASVLRNKIGTVRGASTWSAIGILYTTTTNTGTSTIANNMIHDVQANGTSGDLGAGIFIGGVVGTVNVFYNSVTLRGTLTGGTHPSFGFASGSSTPTLNIRNNIFSSTGSTGANLNRAMGFNYSTFTNVTSNNNDLVFSGTSSAAVQTVNLTNSGSTSHSTLVDWNTASSKDLNSISVAPTFTSVTDLHLVNSDATNISNFYNKGAVVSVTTDFDGSTRGTINTDIGVDEFIPTTTTAWEGNTSTDWATATNWKQSSTPTSGTHIIIPGTAINQPVLSGATSIGNLTYTGSGSILSVNGNTLTLNGTISGSGFVRGSSSSEISINGSGALGTLNFDQTTDGTTNILNNFTLNRTTSGTVTLGNKLVVLNSLIPTDGTLTTGGFLHLRSNATNTARVGVVGATASILGNVIVERYLPAGRKWRLLTAPITQGSPQTLASSWQTQVDIVGPTGSNLSTATPPAVAHNFLTYNSASDAWVFVSDPTSVNLTGSSLNNAFCAFIPGPAGTNHPNSANVTLSSTGSLLTGNNSFTSSFASGKYILIPNPYASPVNLETIFTGSTGINPLGTIYTWDPRLGGGAGTGGYISIKRDGANTFTITGGTTDQTQVIQSGQAFFVEANAATQSINFTEASKSTSNINTVFGAGTGNTDLLRIGFNRYESSAPVVISEVLSRYSNNYNTAISKSEDAEKLWNNEENIALRRGNYNLSIESRPFIGATNDSIFIGLSSLRSNTNYALEFKPSNWDAGSKAYLIDKLLSTETLIDLNAASFIHQFTSTVATANDRFVVVFRGATLPNKNFIVGAEKLGTSKVKVNWEAQGETGVKEYSLEKSVDGVNYQLINTQVAKNGNSNSKYTFTDNNPVNGVNYYRVKTTQQNDIERYSSVVTVNFKQNNATPLTVYPNPVRGNQIGLQLQEVEQGMYSIRLISVDGREVYKQQLQVGSSRGLNTTISPQTKLSTGTYTLQVVGKNQSYTQKVVVE